MSKRTFYVKDCSIRINLTDEFLVCTNDDDVRAAIEKYLQDADFNNVDDWELQDFDYDEVVEDPLTEEDKDFLCEDNKTNRSKS